jgi:O-antigen/teichoic acid export membrane protein
LACVVIPFTVFIAFFADDLIVVWLGPEYLETALILKVLFFAVIFRTLSKLGDSLLRARDAVYKGSWFKAIYVILIALAIYIGMPYGMPWVAFGIVCATFIHYIMNMYLCTQLIGISWTRLFTSLLPALKLGVATLLLSGLVYEIQQKIQAPHLVVLLFAGAYVFGAIAAMIFFRPDQLGDSEINLLYYLPVKLKSKTLVRKMLERLPI